MKNEPRHNLQLGIFLITGTLVLIAGLYFIGKNRNLFGKTYVLKAQFENIYGLQAGNNVRYAGIDVGTVEEISIENDSTITVTMSIENKMKLFIRSTSTATIGTDGLMGNKLVNLDPGDPQSPYASDGMRLPSTPAVNTEEMLRTLYATNSNVEQISSNLKELTGNINRSRGILYTMLMDTSLAQQLGQTMDRLHSTSGNLNRLTGELAEDIHEGQGVVGELLNDSSRTAFEFRETMNRVYLTSQHLETATIRLNQTLEDVRNGKGSAGTIISDSLSAEHLRRSLMYIDSSAYQFNQTLKALQHHFLFRRAFRKMKS